MSESTTTNAATPPPPTLLEAARAVVEGIERTHCHCDKAYSGRGLVDPACLRCGIDVAEEELAALRDAVRREDGKAGG